MERLEATVGETTYRNEENGYTVLQVRAGRERVTVVGSLPELAAGEQVVLMGEWMEHPQYGKQLKASQCEILKPTTLLGIERYLGSGLIKGVGPATAKLIVAHFGKDALDILSQHPERIIEVPTVGAKRAELIAKSYHEQMHTRRAMVFLQSYGVAPTLAVKISRLYGESAQEMIQQNPYRLVEDIEGVGFLTADRIAISMGIPTDSPYRIRAGLFYTLQEGAINGGHTCLPVEELIGGALRILRAERDLIEVCLQEMVLKREVVKGMLEDAPVIYLPLYHSAEREVSMRLHELMAALPYRAVTATALEISDYEKAHDISFHPEQRRAIQAAIDEGIAVITGGPGTGKTTIINCMIRLLSKEGEVALCAPSGRAAKRMTEATGVEAKTIHRLLEYGGDDNNFSKNQENPLEVSCVIVDEMSMVDIVLMRNLLRAITPGTRLILVGDADQLPSVGAGNVLEDILKSDVVPSVRLTEIYRQDENSMIVVNAHRINHGEMPILNSKNSDVFFEKKQGFQEAAETIVALCTQRLPAFLKLPREELLSQALRQIQVLSPTKKGECGVWTLNRLMQQAINPPGPGKAESTYGETVFRVGDKVMQIKNDYNIPWTRNSQFSQEEGTGVFNGDVGYIESISEEDHAITVCFDDDKIVTYEDQQREALELAYCLSVHKSQGSEFPVVVMPVVGGPPMLLTRNLFYTAITRARQLVVLVGREDVIAAMVRNNHVARRYTTLCQRLKELTGWIPG